MADRDLRLRILMDAADRVTRPLRDITGGAGRAAEALRGTRQALQRINDQQGQLNAFRTLRTGMAQSEAAMRTAQARATALGREMRQTANPTREMSRAFEQAKREAAQLAAQHQAQTRQLQDLRRRLRETGVDTRDLARHERELRDRARDTTREMEEQERQLERLTRRQQRFGQARDRFNNTMGTAQNVAGAGLGMLATAGAMALPIVAGVKAAQEYESVMTDIGQKANLSRAATANMGADLLRAARAANQMPDAMQGGVDTLAGFGLDPRQATQMMKPIGKAATAYKAEIADLAAASFAAHDNLKIPIAQTERMIDGMAAAGKAGAFEMKDMAQYFPSLTAAYQGLGQKGVAAGVDLASALQITRKGAGDSATAANNLQNVLQKITSPATVRAFKKMGVDLPASLKKMYAEGKGPIEAIAELTNKTLKGDLSKMGYLFEDAQVQGGLRPLIQNMEEYRRIRTEAGNASGVTNTDFAERMRDSAQQTKQLEVNASTLAIQLGTVLLPTVNDLLGKASAMAARIGDWSQRNPGLTKTLVMAAVAITALTGAAALMTLGYAAAMGPMALFGALSTATGIGMLPIIGTVLAVVAAIALLSYGAYKLYQNWDGIVGWFSGLWQRVRAVFVDNWASIRNLLLGAVVVFLPPVAAMMWLVSMIYRNWDSIRAGFNSGMSYLAGIVAPFTGPFMQIVNFLVGLQSRFAQLGLHLIQGLGRGILSAVGWVIGLITNVASTLGGAFAKAMGIKSPSRVFMAYGGHLMSGLHNGIDADAAAPVGRMTRLSRDLTDALDVGARTPTLAGRAPGAGGGSPYPGITPRTGPAGGGNSYHIKIESGTGDPAAIKQAVREAIEEVEREKAAQGRSRFADQSDWSA